MTMPLTMNSVVRRIVDAPDAASIVEYFVEPIEETRAATAADIVASGMERITKTVAPAAASGTASPVATSPPPVTATGGARKALCVGIDKYGAPYDLAGCVNDATNWAKTLRSLDFDVTTLHDRAATRGAILESFGALVRAARPGDVIVFQFAGHGTQVDDLDRDEDDSLDEAFCPADFADGRLLIDDDIKSVVASMQPGVNLTCFIDCCHSGTITRALVPGGRPGSVRPEAGPGTSVLARHLESASGVPRESRGTRRNCCRHQGRAGYDDAGGLLFGLPAARGRVPRTPARVSSPRER